MKKIVNKILFPNKTMGFLIFNIGFGLLIYVFYNHLEDTPISYVSYVLSFYALVIFIIWFCKMCRFGSRTIKSSNMYHLYKAHHLKVTKSALYTSLISNLIYDLFKLWIGIHYLSWWFITFAIYYLILCVIKIALVKDMKEKSNPLKEYKKVKITGITLLFLNIILTSIIMLIINENKVINYGGVLIYLVALYDFYIIIMATIKVIKYRKNNRPIIAASKCINLTVAMISMVSLEVAMVCQFGNNDNNFKMLMTSSMGMGICIINSLMAIYMIIRASKFLKETAFQNS